MEDLYLTLEVPNNATFEEIKQSYQRLILKYHPDKYDNTADDTEKQKFFNIQKAWETLRDENLRKQYNINFDGTVF